MTASTTRVVLEELLARMGGSDAGWTAELFAERVDWQAAGSETLPWLRPRSTRADMADFFATLNGHMMPEKRTPSLGRVIIDGEDAVVTGHITQTYNTNGREFTTPFAVHITVQDGLITRYHVYEDSLTVAEAFAA